MSYLARLKQKFPENARHGEATKVSKGAFVPFVPPVSAPLRQITATTNELFAFNTPGDASIDTEVRWQADKEKCWRGFLLNAQRVLDAPRAKREALLARYRVEAIRHYGPSTGSVMAEGLRLWVEARLVH